MESIVVCLLPRQQNMTLTILLYAYASSLLHAANMRKNLTLKKKKNKNVIFFVFMEIVKVEFNEIYLIFIELALIFLFKPF